MNALRVSMVAHGVSTEPKGVLLSTIVKAIREGRWDDRIVPIRKLFMDVLRETHDIGAARKSITEMKLRLPGIMFSGVFARRDKDHLRESSGLVTLDIDNIPPAALAASKEAIQKDPSVVVCGISPSGAGLKVVYATTSRGSVKEHSEAFELAKRRLEAMDFEVDASGRDLARLAFVFSDPDVYFNPEAIPLTITGLPAVNGTRERAPWPAPAIHDVPPGFDLNRRIQIASSLFGPPILEKDGRIWIECPGKDLHESGLDAPRDCELHLEKVPNLHCFHNHCSGAVAEANRKLQSEIGKCEYTPSSSVARIPKGVQLTVMSGETPEEDPKEDFDLIPWPPDPSQLAFHGLAGDIVNHLEPHSEGDKVAMLIHLLSAFGCMAGPNAHALVSGMKHPARLWAVIVGRTAAARKGTAWSTVKYFLNIVDPRWCKLNVKSGLSSGEGLIHNVRDPSYAMEDGQEIESDHGIQDKRLFVVEPEFASVLKVAGRERNTISNTMRQAWDDGHLSNLTKNSPLVATGAHICVVGHVTKSDLGKYMGECEVFNGFANRFLWTCAKRSKVLPEGGELAQADWSYFAQLTGRALTFARGRTEVRRSEAAKALWNDIYRKIASVEHPGVLGGVSSRAEAQLLRLSLTYALLDCSEEILPIHIKAAFALWVHCMNSISFIFDVLTGDPTADKIRGMLKNAPNGLSRTEIYNGLKKNYPASVIAASLQVLLAREMIEIREVTKPGRAAVQFAHFKA